MTTTPPPIRRPGIDVVQAVRTTPVRVIKPILQEVIVGPCYKVLETTNTDGSLNSDARLSLPAIFQTLGFDGVDEDLIVTPTDDESVSFQINGGVPFTVTFKDGIDYTPADVATAIQDAADLAGSPVVAEAVQIRESGGTNYVTVRVRTVAKGDGASIKVTCDPNPLKCEVFLAMELPLNWEAAGRTKYENERLFLTQDLLPDPWNMMDDLDIVESSVRNFLTTASSVKKELSKLNAVSRGAKSKIVMTDDGDGDGSTAILTLKNDATAIPNDVQSTVTDADAGNLATTPTAGTVSSVDDPPMTGKSIVLGIDGWQKQTITFASGLEAEQVALINRYFPGCASVSGNKVKIDSLTFGREGVIYIGGPDAHTMFGGLAADYPKMFRGDWQPAAVGDDVYVGGERLGAISQIITSGTGVDNVVKLDTEWPLDKFGTDPAGETNDWYVVSRGLDAQERAEDASARTTPELYVNTYVIQIRHEVLRGTRGEPMEVPVTPSDVKAYDSWFYEALRLDVTVKASTRDPVPVEIRGNDFTNLESQFAPLDAQNPLGLAGYFALLNSGDTPILLFGVDEVSEDYPYGTPDAYARAFDALRGVRGYEIVPLSQDKETALNLNAHVVYMSKATRRGERRGFVTTVIPTRDEPTVVGSGTEGNAPLPGGTTEDFETGLADLGDLFVAAGLTTSSGWTEADDGVYLEIEGDTNHYLVTGYDGATLHCEDSTTTDPFFAKDLWAAAVIDKSFSISIRGRELLTTAGDPDRPAQATAIGKYAAQFASRRMRCGAPGEVQALVSGLETRLPTFYLAAAQSALRCATHPSKPLTNSPVAGFTKVLNSNGYFAEDDMDQAAGYGVWWWINDEATAAVMTRHQLTTDPTSLTTQEDSIGYAIDFGAYCFRDSLRPMIGTVNITNTSLDNLSMGADSVMKFLTEASVWLPESEIIQLIQGPFEATEEDVAEGLGPGGEDEVLLEVLAVIGKPFNRLRVRIVI